MTDQLLKMIEESEQATGVDLSKWVVGWDPESLTDEDYQRMMKIIDFAIIRAGYGGSVGGQYKDELFDKLYSVLEKNPRIIRGFYWYFSSHSPWEDQYNFLYNIICDKEFEIIALDFEAYLNEKTAGFALTAVRFLKKLQKDFPEKKILIYSNKWIYQEWIRYFTEDIDSFEYWHAQYPWATWQTITEYFISWWANVYSKLTKKPLLPSSRSEGDWVIWQVGGDKTFIGQELGFTSDQIDFNVSRLTLEEFVAWSNVESRWLPDDSEEPDTENQTDTDTLILLPWVESMDVWARGRGFDGPLPNVV